MRILLVEDDPMIGESVRAGLRQDGFAVDWVQDGRAAEVALGTEPFELVLLDLGLPRLGGLELLRGLRGRKNDVPVVIITARDAVSDRIAGLDAGADDYVVKPFDLDELAARIRAVARRRSGRSEAVIKYRDLTLNPATRETSVDGRTVALSGREFALLLALLERPGAVLSRAQLEEKLYGWNEEVESNAVEVHIHALRRKLGANLIKNIRGVGYYVPKRP
ncbi:MAG: response regulator transcription factor [Burkholderiales bacterium]|nr:response regulator transcription factor [Burkholderiales bacterium]